MQTILITLIPIFGIMLIGAFSERFKILPSETSHCLGQFIYYFAMPMLLFYLMATADVKQMSYEIILFSSLALVLTSIVTIIILKTLKLSLKQAVLGSMLTSFSNSSFMGIPVIMLLYPNNDEALTAAALLAILTTLSYLFTDIFLGIEFNKSENKFSLVVKFIKTIIKNPTLLCVLFGAIIGFGEIDFPSSVLEITRMIGSTASPCALFCMGISLYTQIINLINNKKSNTYTLQIQSIILLLKFIAFPLFMYISLLFTDASQITAATLIIVAGLPTGVSSYIVAVRHNIYPDLTSNTIVVGTLLSLITLPIFVFLLN